MSWTIGDVDASPTLTNNDHLYPAHLNELRRAGWDGLKGVSYYGTGHTDVEIQAAIDAVNA